MYTKNNRKCNQKQVKKPTIDKQKLLSYILAGLIIFWTVAGVFGFIAYGRSSRKTSNVITASAKTRESDEPVVVNGNINSIYLADFNVPKYRVDFSSVSGIITNDTQSVAGDPNGGIITHQGEVFVSSFYIEFVDDDVTVYYDNEQVYNNETMSFYAVDDVDIVGYTPTSYSATLRYPSNFDYLPTNINYSYVVLDSAYFYYTSNADVLFPLGRLSFYYVISFTYYDLNNYVVTTNSFFMEVEIPAFSGDANMFLPSINQELVKEDLYYLTNYLADTDDSEMLYGDGKYYFYTKYSDYQIEVAEQRGYNEGHRIGYAKGLEEGANLNKVYTFENLLSAVFDVPIRTFASMFDFEILGLNIAQFFFGLISVAIGLAIIRIIF